MTDQITGTDLILEKDLRTSCRFLQENTLTENLELIEAFILNKVFVKTPEKLSLVNAALQLIRQRKGDIGVNELSLLTGCHQRNLERLFREYVGLSPKKLCTLNRIHNFIHESRKEMSAAKFTAGALSSGYFDQAHLNHEFKAITGITPTDYFRDREHLAVNFFSI
nr:helix-turn-helix domain-containing protein [Terrimonas ginsenosidimutans]